MPRPCCARPMWSRRRPDGKCPPAGSKPAGRASRTKARKQAEESMTGWMNLAAALCLAVVGVAGQGAAQAAEITVLGGMGVISGIRDLAAGFEKATGHKVNAVFAQNVMAVANSGAPADIVALNPPVID